MGMSQEYVVFLCCCCCCCCCYVALHCTPLCSCYAGDMLWCSYSVYCLFCLLLIECVVSVLICVFCSALLWPILLCSVMCSIIPAGLDTYWGHQLISKPLYDGFVDNCRNAPHFNVSTSPPLRYVGTQANRATCCVVLVPVPVPVVILVLSEVWRDVLMSKSFYLISLLS